MKIYIKTITGVSHEVDCKEDDQVHDLMQKAENLTGIPYAQQRMIYTGKHLDSNFTLWQYNIEEGATIHIILRGVYTDSEPSDHDDSVQQRDSEKTSSPPLIETTHPEEDEPDLDYDQGFDDDDYLIDPESHYDMLNNLEKMVVESSEYYHSNGNYQPTLSHIERDALLSNLHCDADVSKYLDKITRFSSSSSVPPKTPREGSHSTICAALSLGKSYLIVAHVLDILENLTQKEFCHDGFTVLVERAVGGGGIAEMIMVKRDTIVNFHKGIAHTIKTILKPGWPLYDRATIAEIFDILLPACDGFMEALGITFGNQLSPQDVLLLCRVLALVLDIGLVSYMGSHGSRFDLEYFNAEKSEILVASDTHSKIGLVLSLQKLACLDHFLNSQQVWTFQPLRKLPEESGSLSFPLSILTSIEAFADTWGPLWIVPAGEDFPDYIRQLNVSTGLICRAENRIGCSFPDTVPCHWFNASGLIPLPSKQEHDSILIRKNQKLLIGGLSDSCLKTNQTCSYKLDHLERDYGLHMSPLGTSESAWVHDERQIGFSVSQYIGFTVQGVQKKIPCVTQKQSIMNKWTNQPTRANPLILNSLLGVEISHCTGNAKRVKIRDLFAMDPIQALIERQFPDYGWTTDFGLELSSALCSDDDKEIERVWKEFYKLGELVRYVLELLDPTGTHAGKFNAAFFNQNRELSMPIEPRLNTWTRFLEDSHLTAVYAIVNQRCLDSGELGHFVSTCNSVSSSTGITVLETQIAIPNAEETKDKIWLRQRGCLQGVKKLDRDVHIVTWDHARARELGGRVGKLWGSKPAPDFSREVQDKNELSGHRLSVLVKSTVPSHGGFYSKRTVLAKQGFGEPKVEPLGNSLPIRAKIQPLLPLQYVTPHQQQQAGPSRK